MLDEGRRPRFSFPLYKGMRVHEIPEHIDNAKKITTNFHHRLHDY
uniref:Uncharacterized protein n=1 Tax=Arundo donax TaxID=35708 RepID=A0A0A9AHC3_ARUDO